jgi:RsiW-degrading membrane proteinase PrsW (M82 family)
MNKRTSLAASAHPASTLLRDHLLALSVASLGGLAGILGAIMGESQAQAPLLNPIFWLHPFLGNPFFWFPAVIAPVVEEVMKPFGVYLLLFTWPHLLKHRLHTALLAAWGGLLFGLIEALLYVGVYVDDPSRSFIVYRFSLPLVLHTTTSFIFGLALDQRLVIAVKGQAPLAVSNFKFMALAIAIHSAFNRIAMVVWPFV